MNTDKIYAEQLANEYAPNGCKMTAPNPLNRWSVSYKAASFPISAGSDKPALYSSICSGE